MVGKCCKVVSTLYCVKFRSSTNLCRWSKGGKHSQKAMKKPASKVAVKPVAKNRLKKPSNTKPVPKKLDQTAVPSSERGPLFAEEAFDAASFANRFRYGDCNESAAAITEARKEAVLSQKPRVLKWSTSKSDKSTMLTVIFSSGSGHLPLQDKVHLWSLKQMVEFACALGATGTRRTRSAGLLPSPEAVCTRCPPLWWSLAMWAFAQTAGGSSGKGKGTTAGLPTCPNEPTAMPGDFPKLLHTLLECGKNGATEREVRKSLMTILMHAEAQ